MDSVLKVKVDNFEKEAKTSEKPCTSRKYPPTRHTRLNQPWINVDSALLRYINVKSMLVQLCPPNEEVNSSDGNVNL